MRLGHIAPVAFGLFVALACGSNSDESKVEGGNAATGNINTGQAGGLIGVGNGTGTGGNGSGASGPVGPGDACVTSAADGEPVPVDLYFMVDTTGSMNCLVPENPARPCDNDPGAPGQNETSRWELVSEALKTFMGDPGNQGLGVGVRFFPSNRNSCSVASYARPNVAIGPLSMTSAPIIRAIDGVDPGGSTPTVPSLAAAVQHAGEWATQNPTHKVVVVYATDGQPKGCDNNTPANTPANAALEAKKGADKGIPTYVLGVGPGLDNLNAIAAAGGTKTAFLVDTNGDAAAQLSAALAAIRGNVALDCTYTIPPPPAGQTLEPGKVNVSYTDTSGVVTNIGQDPDDVACDQGTGWKYSADGKQINLCGSFCEKVKADPGGKLQVLFGCETVVGDPPK